MPHQVVSKNKIIFSKRKNFLKSSITKSLLLTGLLSCFSASVFAESNIAAHNNTPSFESSIEQALTDNDIELAQQAFHELEEKQKNSLTGKVLYSRLLFREDKTEQSYDLLEDLSEDNQNNADIQYYFGRSAIVMAQQASLFSKLGYASDALDAWQQTLKLDPKHIKALDGLISFHVGAPSIAGGDIEQGLAYSKTLIEIDPEAGFANLAKVYWKKEQADLAQQAIADGLKLAPNSGRLYFTQALGYMGQKNKQWSKVHHSLKKALTYAKSDKEKQNVLYQIGKVSAVSGEETKVGITALEQLIVLDSKDYSNWAKLRLAQLYLDDGQAKQAMELVSAVNYDDDNNLEDEVKKLKKKLKKAS